MHADVEICSRAAAIDATWVSAAPPSVILSTVVDVLLFDDEGELRMSFKFHSFQTLGRTLWRKPETDTMQVAGYGVLSPSGRWFPSEDGKIWHEEKDAVTEPPLPSWQWIHLGFLGGVFTFFSVTFRCSRRVARDRECLRFHH